MWDAVRADLAFRKLCEKNYHIQNQEYNGWRLNVVKNVKILCQGFGWVRQGRNWTPYGLRGKPLYEVKDV